MLSADLGEVLRLASASVRRGSSPAAAAREDVREALVVGLRVDVVAHGDEQAAALLHELHQLGGRPPAGGTLSRRRTSTREVLAERPRCPGYARTGEPGADSAASTKKASSRYRGGEGEPFTTSALSSRGTASTRAAVVLRSASPESTTSTHGPALGEGVVSVFCAVPLAGRSQKTRMTTWPPRPPS